MTNRLEFPRFIHECPHCTFLGWYDWDTPAVGPTIPAKHRQMDLWRCAGDKKHEEVIIGKMGNEKSDYVIVSGPEIYLPARHAAKILALRGLPLPKKWYCGDGPAEGTLHDILCPFEFKISPEGIEVRLVPEHRLN